MLYLGHDPNSMDPAHITEVEDMMKAVRPYIRYFHSSRGISDLPNEELCISMSWSGDYAQAMQRAIEVGADVRLAYSIPKEGTVIWFDGLFIPADAPHPGNAHLFINYLLRPEVIAEISNFTRYANANLAALHLCRPRSWKTRPCTPRRATGKHANRLYISGPSSNAGARVHGRA